LAGATDANDSGSLLPTPVAHETGRSPEQHMAMRRGIGRSEPSSLMVAVQMLDPT